MPRIKPIRIDELPALAAAHPEIGKYDAKRKELKTPDGQTIGVEAGRVGRSEKIYVTGKARDFLKGLGLPELQRAAGDGAEKAGKAAVSLSEVPSRQACSARSWKAWFKRNYRANPQEICKAVTEGYGKAAEDIRKAQEEEAEKEKREAEARYRKLMQGMKEELGGERFLQMAKEV